ncbi:SprB repeat-containing protein [Niabella sp. 22666]|uniref:SprB repeat-containing protein n=1 Tax=Niabella sp. 22666 TaxID=3453954 RepID=UPI003F87251A
MQLPKYCMLLNILLIRVILFAQSGSQTFDASGTFTVPAGITKIYVEAWGGGGGGTISTIGAANYRYSGSGGGGGGFSRGYVTVVPGSSINVIVGAGGGIALAGGSSSAGGVVAGGGQAARFEQIGSAAVNTFGGAGGTGTFRGGNGGNGVRSDPGQSFGNGGGGGGSATRTANGMSGSGYTGGSGEGNGGSGSIEYIVYTVPSTAGAAPGGGGGDHRSGADGRVIISWTAPVNAEISKTDITCFQGYGTARVTASGGDGTYAYLWTPGNLRTAEVNNLLPGAYTCLITSGHEQTTVSVEIPEGPQMPGLIPTGNSSATVNQTADGNYNYYLSGCNTAIAMIYTTNTPDPLNGPTTARVWVNETQDRRYVRRHYDILPQNNPSTATARVTLFFSQEDFDSYNATRPKILLPVDANDSRNYRGNIYIEKRSGNGNGVINQYTGAPVTIHPQEVVWDNVANRWEVVFFTTGFSGFWLKAGDEPIALPVIFGAVEASVSNGTLAVNWTSQAETNNAYFQVEASADGNSFTIISDKIVTQAEDGNSSVPLQYRFARTYTGIVGASIFILLSLLSCRSRRLWTRLYLLSSLLIWAFFACNKSANDLLDTSRNDVFVRIVQTDKDGVKTYSKTIKAIKQ